MKLDPCTLSVLKNFSSINPSLLVKPGNVLATINASRSIYARVIIPIEFPSRFAVHDLSKFISALSLFDGPELSITDKAVLISDSTGRKVNYFHSAESTIKDQPPDKDIVLPAVEVSFKLLDKVLKDVIKAAYVLGLSNITITGDGTDLVIGAEEIKKGSEQNSSNTYSVRTGPTDKVFKAVFKADNISKVLAGDYDVSISKQAAKFSDATKEYFIAVEATSTF